MHTGPLTRAQHAIRVFGASPSRSSVERSSAPTAERFPMPSTTATGSAPHTPMRQPASIGMPFASATSSRVWPGATTTRWFPGANVTSGAPARVWRWLVSDRAAAPAAATAAGGRATSSRNGRSFAHVRRTHVAASAIAATRSAHVTASGPGATCQ